MNDRPIFVGGFPGSGTRVISKILQKAGIFMGNKINDANDSVFLAEFLEKWTGQFLEESFQLNIELQKNMKEEFFSYLENHLDGNSQEDVWGSKNPRNVLILPFLHDLFPNMKFIQVIRDGRDLAESDKKRRKIKQYSKKLIGKEVQTKSDLVELWSSIMFRGLEYGEANLGSNFLQVKFEDLCTNSEEIVQRILLFIGINQKNLQEVISEINPPQNAIGRWKKSKEDFENLSELATQGLKKFGYLI